MAIKINWEDAGLHSGRVRPRDVVCGQKKGLFGIIREGLMLLFIKLRVSVSGEDEWL